MNTKDNPFGEILDKLEEENQLEFLDKADDEGSGDEEPKSHPTPHKLRITLTMSEKVFQDLDAFCVSVLGGATRFNRNFVIVTALYDFLHGFGSR